MRQKQAMLFFTLLFLVQADDHRIVFTEVDLEETTAELNQQSESEESGVQPRSSSSNCSCSPNYLCHPEPPTNGAGQIDIRIVTKPPSWVTCTSGMVYCCISQPQTVQCGSRSKIFVPGVKIQPGQAYFGEYPWQAVILRPDNQYIGSGALLDSTHILTAAHKVASYPYVTHLKVRMGEWNIQDNSEPYKYLEYNIAKIVIHPCYNANNLHNDIAVITLQEPVPVWPHINTICMPQPNMAFTGQRCWVSGWGKDAFGAHGNFQKIQKEVDVPILNSRDCERQLQGTRLGSYFHLDQKSFLCAGGEQDKDACTGDGGSPLVCEQGGRFYLVGMVAWGIGCAHPGIPGVYVNVPNYRTWISQQME